MSMDFIELGKKGNSKELRDILNHIFERNNILNDDGKRETPICIWGTHGLGKTQIVRDYAINKGWKFSYIAPAILVAINIYKVVMIFLFVTDCAEY